ncbi:MAG TPA: phosphopyruvate hydratase [archaeon]|nr:phosphopyruvate hydratase [archaeon]
MPMVDDLKVRRVLNSRASWALELDLLVDGRQSRASVPAGKSKGKLEAVQLPAEKSLKLAPAFGKKLKRRFENQTELDRHLIKLAGPGKRKTGADLTLATSIAFLKSQGDAWEVISRLTGSLPALPTPMFNIINGGLHAGNNLAVQEFMIVPHDFGSFSEKVEAGVEIYAELKKQLEAKYGRSATNLGDEGGFAPPMNSTVEALEMLEAVLAKTGYAKTVGISLDCAASSYHSHKGYQIDGQLLNREDYLSYLAGLCEHHSLFSVEDPLEETDFKGFATFLDRANTMVVGDDLLVTNPTRLAKAIRLKAGNAVLVKPNQIGTVTETLEVIRLAREAGWKFVVSHRSGETNDTFITHLAVGTATPFIKTGAPARGERVAKYNELLRLEEVIA